MTRSIFLASLALTLVLVFPVAAEVPNLKQTRVNLTLTTQSFSGLAPRLQNLAVQHQADLQNLNLSSENSNGNATIRIAPDKLAGFLQELATLGDVTNQSIHTNDNTSSYLDYQRRLATFEALAKADASKMLAQLPAAQRQDARAEYESFIRDRIRSYRNNLENYKTNYSQAEISINFRQPEMQQQPTAVIVETPETGNEVGEQAVQRSSEGLLMPLYLLVFFNLLGLWAVHRKLDQPGVQSDL